MLGDILQGDDRVLATVAVLVEIAPDILVLQDVDYDAGGAGLGALAAALEDQGLTLPNAVALRPNSGWLTGFDLDGDGRTTGPRDAHGYGMFNGDGGLALLSRYPIATVRDHSAVLWQDLPQSHGPSVTPVDALGVLRLHSVAAWEVEIETPRGVITLLASHASAPVFDGPEDRNGLRNWDELRYWQLYLDGWVPPGGTAFAAEHFAVLGTFNVDPDRGEGRREGVLGLISHPSLQDPVPQSDYGTATTDWDDPTPGDLRVDYILPSDSLRVLNSGVFWPTDGPMAETVAEASDHRLVWVDVAF